ncbi:hypothetical protein Bsph_2327 [Lysinibacillus sphaericus C3-41]|uniref:Uncharacterized protein n=1 Tax=Lysinibacillus sphaericus (strain C3-41) TaxID=444177 RepID=B1HW38_LYSSC|nr:hypothetical protein Bsph_2327 [Lysinibacillus sphaericus C3-41]
MLVLAAAGMALALAGAVLQGVTRNDLADPGLLVLMREQVSGLQSFTYL